MNVLSECRDARTEYSKILAKERRYRDVGTIMEDALADAITQGTNTVSSNTYDLFEMDSNMKDCTPDDRNYYVNDIIGKECSGFLDMCMSDHSNLNPEQQRTDRQDMVSKIREEDQTNITGHNTIMNSLKRKRRPEYSDAPEDKPTKRKRINETRHPEVIVSDVNRVEPSHIRPSSSSMSNATYVDEIINEVI